MMSVLLQLSLCFVTLSQLTSSQPTFDVIQHDSDVIASCVRTEQMFSQLMTAVTQLQRDVAHLRKIITGLV